MKRSVRKSGCRLRGGSGGLPRLRRHGPGRGKLTHVLAIMVGRVPDPGLS